MQVIQPASGQSSPRGCLRTGHCARVSSEQEQCTQKWAETPAQARFCCKFCSCLKGYQLVLLHSVFAHILCTTQASLDVADPTVSPRRAAAVRDEVTEDEWGSTHRSDPLGIVKAGRYGVCLFSWPPHNVHQRLSLLSCYKYSCKTTCKTCDNVVDHRRKALIQASLLMPTKGPQTAAIMVHGSMQMTTSSRY